MGNFRPLKGRQVWRLVLETTGPRNKKDQQDFRKALLTLIRKNRTTILGYREKLPSKQKARRRR
jgi:hypothetical protein